jgi:hypothetical protein
VGISVTMRGRDSLYIYYMPIDMAKLLVETCFSYPFAQVTSNIKVGRVSARLMPDQIGGVTVTNESGQEPGMRPCAMGVRALAPIYSP